MTVPTRPYKTLIEDCSHLSQLVLSVAFRIMAKAATSLTWPFDLEHTSPNGAELKQVDCQT